MVGMATNHRSVVASGLATVVVVVVAAAAMTSPAKRKLAHGADADLLKVDEPGVGASGVGG